MTYYEIGTYSDSHYDSYAIEHKDIDSALSSIGDLTKEQDKRLRSIGEGESYMMPVTSSGLKVTLIRITGVTLLKGKKLYDLYVNDTKVLNKVRLEYLKEHNSDDKESYWFVLHQLEVDKLKTSKSFTSSDYKGNSFKVTRVA